MSGKVAALAFFAALWCQPAGAEELGRVSFDFQAEQGEWFTLLDESGGKVVASAKLTESRRLNTLAVSAYREPRFSSKEFLFIELLYSKGVSGKKEPDYADPTSVTIVYFTQGVSAPVWVGRELLLEVQAHDLAGGDIGRIEASFSAELCLAEDMYAEPDESTCQPLSGTIETRVLLPSES